MQIDEKELERRLKSGKNLANVMSLPEKKNNPIRVIAGILSHQQSSTQVAREFNMTPGQVMAAKNSHTLQPQIHNGLDRIKEIALDKLCLALGVMTEDKFESAELKDLSKVASDMARVIEKVSPKETQTNTQLIIYAPALKNERSYEDIEV